MLWGGFIDFSSPFRIYMLKLNYKIETCSRDNFLYEELCRLLQEIKLSQGGTDLDATLKRHNLIRTYLISKQIDKIHDLEQTYFNDDGTLNLDSINKYYEAKRSCNKMLSDLS